MAHDMTQKRKKQKGVESLKNKSFETDVFYFWGASGLSKSFLAGQRNLGGQMLSFVGAKRVELSQLCVY